MRELRKCHLLVLASTFPRWRNDSVPTFVLDFAKRMAPSVRSVVAVVPHYDGARGRDKFGNIAVRRFRYAYPYRYENIAYGQFQKTRFYPVKALLYAVSEFVMTLRVATKSQPVIINAHWLIPQGFVAVLVAPLLGAKVVVSVHGADVFTLNGKYMRKVKRFVLQRADAVVVNSSVTQAECVKLWPGREYPVIPMGINTDKFKPAQRTKQETFTVLFVGRLTPQKGVLLLCKAVQKMHKQHADVRLVVVGDGPERTAIEQYVTQHKLERVVSLIGWVQPDKLPDYYHKATVFAGPSYESEKGRKEALGLVFAEAAACGLPVVTTDAGGMADIVRDKVTGLIVPQKNVAALHQALEYLYVHSDEARAMGRRGSAYVRQNFSWQSVIKRYTAVLETAV